MRDFEGELVVIIGNHGRHIPQDEAFNHIARATRYLMMEACVIGSAILFSFVPVRTLEVQDRLVRGW